MEGGHYLHLVHFLLASRPPILIYLFFLQGCFAGMKGLSMRATFQRFVPTFEVLLQLLDSNYMGRGAKNHFGHSYDTRDASCLSSQLIIANVV